MSKAITQYLEDQNRWNVIFGVKPTPFPATVAEVDELLRSVENELSPENLHMDGEGDPRKVRDNYDRLSRVEKELKGLKMMLEVA